MGFKTIVRGAAASSRLRESVGRMRSFGWLNDYHL